jgi:hypothetical protein
MIGNGTRLIVGYFPACFGVGRGKEVEHLQQLISSQRVARVKGSEPHFSVFEKKQ